VTTWSLFDPEATGFIEWYILPSFIEALDTPMGFDKVCKPSAKDIAALIGTVIYCYPVFTSISLTGCLLHDRAEVLDLPIFRGNKVFFNDVARRIGKFVVDEVRVVVGHLSCGVDDVAPNVGQSLYV
jgi:hypothetical protein